MGQPNALTPFSPTTWKVKPQCEAFAANFAAYLQHGIGLMVLDIVTSRQANLHDELMDLLNRSKPFRWQPPGPCMRWRTDRSVVAKAMKLTFAGSPASVAPHPFASGCGGYLPVPLDLEATYSDACYAAGSGSIDPSQPRARWWGACQEKVGKKQTSFRL